MSNHSDRVQLEQIARALERIASALESQRDNGTVIESIGITSGAGVTYSRSKRQPCHNSMCDLELGHAGMCKELL